MGENSQPRNKAWPTDALATEQYSTNKNNASKNTNAPKEPATKGQHSYAINISPQNKLSTYDLNKFVPSIIRRVLRPRNFEQHFAVKTKINKPAKIMTKKTCQQLRKPTGKLKALRIKEIGKPSLNHLALHLQHQRKEST
ncbi:unnamed protein product [Brassica rapa]|uniref:Uncharacterized protein n=1 Tax=Brassica campestris TaxID=3711 RepID=A0A3P6B106_BRACM|nr:unnamed protein product [Brassica rapa]VDC90018.1 unnamed protein product [Brassica rapa]